MKKLLSLCLLVVTMCAVAQQKKTVAILDAVDKQGNIPAAYLSMIRNTMITVVTNTSDYEAYDRTSLDAIASEQNFQRSGQVDDEQIKRLGKMAGVDYVLVTEADAVDGWLTMIVKILNVETAKYEKAIDSDFLEMKPQNVQAGVRSVANKLFGGSSVYTTEPTAQSGGTPEKATPQTSVDYTNNNKVDICLLGAISANHKLIEDVKIEYKIISTTSEVASTDYQLLGMTKFAYLKNGKPTTYNFLCSSIANTPSGTIYWDALRAIRQDPFYITGLTSANCSQVSIIFRISKEGYIPQEKGFYFRGYSKQIAKNNLVFFSIITELKHY